MELPQESQLVKQHFFEIIEIREEKLGFRILVMFQPLQVLHVPLEAKLLGLVQSSKGRVVNLDLQFPQAGRGQPQRCNA